MQLRPFPNTAGEPAFMLRGRSAHRPLRAWDATHPDSSASTGTDSQAPGAVGDFAGFSKGEPYNYHVTPQSHPLTSIQKNPSRYLHTTFTTALVTTAKLWKHNKCPSEDEYANVVYPYNGIFRQAPAVRGAKPSLCHAPPVAKVACRGVILPSRRSSPVVDLPPHQTWTAGQRPGGVGTRRVAPLATIRPRSCG